MQQLESVYDYFVWVVTLLRQTGQEVGKLLRGKTKTLGRREMKLGRQDLDRKRYFFGSVYNKQEKCNMKFCLVFFV